MSDEKLDSVTEQIQKILQDNEVAGLVILNVPGLTRYTAHLSPPWSCCKTEGGNMKVSAAITDFPDKAAQVKSIKETVGMLAALREAASGIFDGMSGMLAVLRKNHNVHEIIGLDKINGHPRGGLILPPGTKGS